MYPITIVKAHLLPKSWKAGLIVESKLNGLQYEVMRIDASCTAALRRLDANEYLEVGAVSSYF